MKIGARAHDFGRTNAHDLSKVVKNAGFDTVQLALTKAIIGINKFSDVTEQHLEDIYKSFSNNKVDIDVLGCYIEPSLLDDELRLKQVESFKLGLKHAKALNVPVVGTETTKFDPTPQNELFHLPREATYKKLLDSVLRMTECAEALNVVIGIEPVADHTLNSATLAQRLLDDINSNKLKIIFDPVNMILEHNVNNQDDIFADFIKILGEHIVAVHVKDIVFEAGEKCWRNIGEGIVNYSPIFEWLRKNKSNMPILREHVKPSCCVADVFAMRKLAGNIV